MSCNLSDDELFILNILYTKHCFSAHAEFNSKLLKKRSDQKCIQDFDKTIKVLVNEGYITPVPKKDMKYYISDRPKAIFALHSHGFNVTTGRERRL